MRKALLFLSVIFFVSVALSAVAKPGEGGDRPAFASDRIKIKLSSDAKYRAELPQDLLSEKSSFGIASLDTRMARNGGYKLRRAHRRVDDFAWEQMTGFDRWFIIHLNGSVDVQDALTDFLEDPEVEEAELEYFMYPQAIPNDPYYASNWGHNNTGQFPSWLSGSGYTGPLVGTSGWDTKAQEAWNYGYGNSNIIIAIIDTGVDLTHPDLRLVTGYDFGDNDSNPMDDSGDAGHGTLASGIAAAKANNNLGVTGIAGGCSIMPLKVAASNGTMVFTSIANAITYAADNGAHVISMSLGAQGTTSDTTVDPTLAYAYNKGVVIFASSGNYYDPAYIQNQNETENTIGYPANSQYVISVGASSPTGQRKSFTSSDGVIWYGSCYGTANKDNRLALDIMAPTELPSTDMQGNAGWSSSDYYFYFGGTSCASPYAAGCAALLLSQDNTLTPAQIRNILTSTATDMTIDGGVGWDRYTGYGMVNIYAALQSITGGIPNPTSFIASTYSTSQIDISWTKNDNNDNVLLAWSPTGTFGTPISGASYDPVTNNSIPGGGIVLYNGSQNNFSHLGLSPKTTYYYRAWSVRDVGKALNYSSGVSISATTDMELSDEITTVPITGNIYNVNQYLPIMAFYTYSYSQQIYTPELVGPGGKITKLRFQYWNNFQATNSNNWTIYFAHTSKTDFSENMDYIPLSSLTQVYSGTFTMPSTYGWLEFTLQTPFTYNGTDNLVIAVDENSAGYHNNSSGTLWGSWSYGTYPALVFFQDGSNIDPANPSASNQGRAAFVPKVQFDIQREIVNPITSFPTTWSFDESYFPPQGWLDLNTSGSTGGVWNGVTAADVSAGDSPSMATAGTHSGSGMASFHSYLYAPGTKGILATPPINFWGSESSVSFWMYRDNNDTTTADRVNVYFNTTANLNGTPVLLGTVHRSYTLAPVEASAGWFEYSYLLPAGAKAVGHIIFEGVDASQIVNGYNMFIDDVTIFSDQPLPVQLSSFTAAISADNYVNLNWVTQTETDVLGFYVLRNDSDDLSSAITVSPLILATNTSSQQSYIFTDRELFQEGTYYYWLQNSDLDGSVGFHGPASIAYSTLDVGTPEIPLVTELAPVYPNPFNPVAHIPYSLKDAAAVTFEIYNVRGQVLRHINAGEKGPGKYQALWDGRDDSGRECSTGIYYVRMTAGDYVQSRKMILCK